MRILTNDYLSNVPGSAVKTKGGPAQFARHFSDAVVAHGHEWIGIFTSRTKQSTGYEEINDGDKKRFLSIENSKDRSSLLRGTAVSEISPAEFEEDIVRIEKIISDIRPDLLFLNGFSLDAWTYAQAAFRARVPVVIQHAGILTKEFDMYKDWFNPAACAFGKAIEGDVAAKATANVFLNEFSRDAFTRLVEPEALSKPVIIPLPHAGWTFEKVRMVPRDARTLGIVARWDRIKNHEAILAFAKEIKRRELPWRIRSVTKIPETPQRADFKKRYKALVEVIPPMEREELHAFYESLDALVLPSHFDVSPTVVMEAVATGKPTLISPNVGWVSEYKACGMNDWIIDFDDPALVVERLQEQFMRDAWPEVEVFSSYVKEHHDPETVYRAYLSLFEQVIS